jgi:hypothetical protein
MLLPSLGKMEAMFNKTSVSTYDTIWYYNPRNHKLKNHHHGMKTPEFIWYDNFNRKFRVTVSFAIY